MKTITLYQIVSEINLRAQSHPIGTLQEIRKELKQLKKLPTHSIFTPSTTHESWAFHHGGRKELQFNVGFEPIDSVSYLRYGVAFSFETSQTLPDISLLLPKVRLFNEFILQNPEQYADMRMWHYYSYQSDDYMPSPIPHENITEGMFYFLGKRQPCEQIDYELLLDDLDRLLPLYRYVEGNGNLQLTTAVKASPFRFSPGFTAKAPSANASLAQKELDINLRHNVLQAALYKQLVKEYGEENVRTELPSGIGTSIDVVVKDGDEFYFYEIKTAHSPRACLRQAMGQLLEYGFWPGTQEAARLIIVGETALDQEGLTYLNTLRQRFSLPLEYIQIVAD